MPHPAPSGRQSVLVHGDQRAVIVEVGGGLRSYELAGRPVLDGYTEAEMCAGGRGQALLPWPNRLADGRYEWGGRTAQLAVSEPETATAIHGLTRWSVWEPVAAGTAWVTVGHRLAAHPGYPWTLDATITYTLDDAGLTVATRVVNRSADPAPFGIGFHPYVWAGGGLVDDCTLTIPAATAYDVDGRGLPAGRHPVGGREDDYRAGRRVGARRLDLPLTDLARDADGRARIVLEAPGAGATTLWMDETWTHVQVFSGDTLGDEGRRRRGLAVEPMTGPANLLASGDGRRTLLPDVPFDAVWGIHHH